MRRVFPLAIATLLLAAAPAHANLIVNGSFETPAVAVGSFTSFTAASATPPTGWSIVGPGAVSIVSGTFTQGGFSFPDQDGVQWLDLTGLSSNTATGVQQTIATTPGATYDLSFWVGNVANFPSPTTTSTVNVLVNGALALAATNSTGGTTLTWEEFDVSFVAASSTTILTFLNGDPANDDSNGLDNIVVTLAQEDDPTPGVPEPATLLLLGVGTAAAAAVRRMRRD